jgi:hypothetical protein
MLIIRLLQGSLQLRFAQQYLPKIQAHFKCSKVHINDLSVKFWATSKYSGEGCAKNSFTASMLWLTSIYLLSIAQGI